MLALVLLALAACSDDDDATPAATTTEAAVEADDGPSVAGLEDAVLAYRDGGDACGGDATELSDGVATFDALATYGGTKLILVTCEIFAYQAAYDIVGWNGESVRAMRVEQWIDGGVSDQSSVVLGSPVFEENQIVNLEKGRGPGDCGQVQIWDYTGDLVLREVRFQECGDGEPNIEQWPVVYETPPSRTRIFGNGG